MEEGVQLPKPGTPGPVWQKSESVVEVEVHFLCLEVKNWQL